MEIWDYPKAEINSENLKIYMGIYNNKFSKNLY